jgi:hypothetical protein
VRALVLALGLAAGPSTGLAASGVVIEAGGGVVAALGTPTAGHVAWLRAGWASGRLEVAGLAAVVYPGGGVASRAPALGLDARVTVAGLARGLGLHVGLLAGWGGADAVASPDGGDLVRWSRRDTFLLAPAVGLVWAPPSSDLPGLAPATPGVTAAAPRARVRLVLEARALNLSHSGLIAGVGAVF